MGKSTLCKTNKKRRILCQNVVITFIKEKTDVGKAVSKKGRKPDGTIIYGSLYGKTYREVKSKLSELQKIEQNIRLPKNHERTFGEVLSLWMEHNRIRLKGVTINKYQNLIDTQIMPELGRVKLSELDSTMINTFLTKNDFRKSGS